MEVGGASICPDVPSITHVDTFQKELTDPWTFGYADVKLRNVYSCYLATEEATQNCHFHLTGSTRFLA